MRLVESVPNFSEGRRTEVIQAIAAAGGPGARLLDLESDPAHNRSVLTLVGEPEALVEAVFRVAAKAVELIDLRAHKGEHPRMGAIDVIPFVPVRGVTMAECVALARRCGERIGRELDVPVYLYQEAATAPHRVNLADVRAGEFEGLAAKMQSPAWQPDFGPAQPHPTAGAVAVGARTYLVAYNINLHTSDVKIAKAIARAIRAKDGGLANVKALGLFIPARNQAQVSINLVDPLRTPIYRVFEAVRAEAARYGVAIAGSEVIGLAPLECLVETARYYLQLEGFQTEQVLETRLMATIE